jgi:hypothetical protein
METPAKCWDKVNVDFVAELPDAQYNTVMNVVDCVRKCMHFILMNTAITTEGTACLYLKEVWKHVRATLGQRTQSG